MKVEIENSKRCFCGAIAGMAEWWWCACWWRTDEMRRTSRGPFISSVRRDTASGKRTSAEWGGCPFKLSVQAERTPPPCLALTNGKKLLLVPNGGGPPYGGPPVVARSLAPTHAKGVPFSSNVLFSSNVPSPATHKDRLRNQPLWPPNCLPNPTKLSSLEYSK